MYWLVSLPLLETHERTWDLLEQKTTYDNGYSINFRFELPDLRVGTLDSLLGLSDDLVKVNTIMEAVVNKIRRQLFDLAKNSDEREDPLVEGVTPESYLEKFLWDEAKYPSRRPLKETVDAITETVQKLEDDLKVKVSEYSQVKSQLSALVRKQTGSLAVRELSDIAKKVKIVDTENLTTVFVAVPKSGVKEFLSSYETLCDFVVPRSAVQVEEDMEHNLFTTVLFKRVLDTFKTNGRNKGFLVREVDLFADEDQTTSAQLAKVQEEAEAKRSQLEAYCLTSYGEAFSGWTHVCAVRLFVESILRYGLPPRFLAVLMKPNPKSVAKLRKLLSSTFGSGGAYFDGEAGAAVGPEGEMFPYVAFTMNIET